MRRIIIEGNIGVGKTTLAGMLSKDLQTPVLLEQFADNPLLPKFYKEGERYSFPLEVSFLLARTKQWKGITKFIADYTLEKCLLFSKLTLNNDEFLLFRELFAALDLHRPIPELLILLDADVPFLQERIHQRGRPYEQAIPDQYLENLGAAYDEFYESWNLSPKIRIQSRDYDFEHDAAAYQAILQQITK